MKNLNIEETICEIEKLESEKLAIQNKLNDIVFNNHDYDNESIRIPSYTSVQNFCSQRVYDDIVSRIYTLIEINHGLGTFCLFEILKCSDKSKELFVLIAKNIEYFSSQEGEDFLILEAAKSFFNRGVF